MSSYWPVQLDYVADIGSQERPCTGMYLFVDAPDLWEVRRVTRPDKRNFAIESLDYAHWCPSASCPEMEEMQDVLLRLKGERGFSYEVNHVRWEIEEGPDLHAMIVVSRPRRASRPRWAGLDRTRRHHPRIAGIHTWPPWSIRCGSLDHSPNSLSDATLHSSQTVTSNYDV
jgi:hypothetical protein